MPVHERSLPRTVKALIVYAHPEPDSFNGAMRDLASDVLRGMGHEVVISDLYRMGFDAAGGPADFTARADPGVFRYQREQIHGSRHGTFAPGLAAEMDRLHRADFLLFQFPLWWFSLPAILKGWVDRVFAMGFAYDVGRSHEQGPFRGKRAMLALTTGSPQRVYAPDGRNGELDRLLFHIQYGMLHYVGMDVLPPFVAWGAVRATDEQRAGYLAAYRDRLRAVDVTPPLRFDVTTQSSLME
jgi:NAD(P)H dehydrogenase (quinone)